jgi:hypothetical protein
VGKNQLCKTEEQREMRNAHDREHRGQPERRTAEAADIKQREAETHAHEADTQELMVKDPTCCQQRTAEEQRD